MSNVIDFNGQTVLDINPDKVLSSAIGELEGCVIIGYTKDGYEYFASSYGNQETQLWLCERFKKQVLEMVEEDD